MSEGKYNLRDGRHPDRLLGPRLHSHPPPRFYATGLPAKFPQTSLYKGTPLLRYTTALPSQARHSPVTRAGEPRAVTQPPPAAVPRPPSAAPWAPPAGGAPLPLLRGHGRQLEGGGLSAPTPRPCDRGGSPRARLRAAAFSGKSVRITESAFAFPICRGRDQFW